MSFYTADTDDQQLINNLHLINFELCSLIDNREQHAVQYLDRSSNGTTSVLHELNSKYDNLQFNSDEPEFEFHGYGCTKGETLLPKRGLRVKANDTKKKVRQNSAGNGQSQLVSRQKQNDLQKENAWNLNECASLDKLRSDVLLCNSTEMNHVLTLIELFQSLHDHINSELPSNYSNSVPSDYVYEMPKKTSMPTGFNVRHHVQVLCTKVERFIARQRRILETNRHFDYTKHLECDDLLKMVSISLDAIENFTNIELRHRSFKFVNQEAKENAKNLQTLLLELRGRLKSAHIHVHVFNWEMDLEHRYSMAMTRRHDATNQHALTLAVTELQASQSSEFSSEEQLIAERYQLTNVVSCFKEHQEFLTALVKSPENYFSPEIIALCNPPQDDKQLPYESFMQAADDVEQLVLLQFAPSSPPRTNRRKRIAKCNRA